MVQSAIGSPQRMEAVTARGRSVTGARGNRGWRGAVAPGRHAYDMPEHHYLGGLDLAGRRVVMVGGGTVAQRRLPRLIGAGASVELISPHTTPAVSAMADAGELVWHRRRYTEGDLDGAWYALAC